MTKIKAADLFCGAGGTSTGLIEACEELDLECELTAINHWDVAIATHKANYPESHSLCASLDSLNPRDLYKDGELDLLWASPECTHHSIARGGKPINDQSRATAWCVTRWAEALRPSIILVENVKEFLSWGPIGVEGRPLKTRKGEVFRAWVRTLEALGYRVDWRMLRAADYGDPTTRERLFIYAVRGRRKIVWPEATHGQVIISDMFEQRQRWLTARDNVIDWSIPGKSIFNPDGSLRHCENTVNRIIDGFARQGRKAVPFVLILRGTSRSHIAASAHSIDEPLSTVCASGTHHMLCEPFVIGQQSGAMPRSVDQPVPTVACAGAIRLVEPMIVKYYRTGICKSVDEPLDTVTTKPRFMLVEPKSGESFGLDIHTRMLLPHELAAAQGFPKDYKFAGNKTEIIRQIGNAVPKNLAKALVRAALTQKST